MKVFYLFVLLLLLGLSPAVRAQSDFRPGYIIPLRGDTVRGSLEYGSNQRSANECRFKTDPTASISKYLPAQLNGYGFLRDRFFHSLRVPAPFASADTAAQVLFLEILVQGAASLYYLAADKTGERYFVRMGSGPVVPLVLQTEMVVENGSKFKREKALYRGVLSESFRACPAVQRKVGEVAFRSSSLLQIVREYNTCVGGGQQVSEVAAPRRRSYLLLEAVAGAQTSALQFAGEISLRDQAVQSGVTPVVGVALQQYLPLLANRFGFRAELLYQRQKYNQEITTPSANAYAAYQDVRVQFDQLRVPVMVRYSPFSGHFRPFAAVGGSVSFALTNTNESRYRALPTSDYSAWRPILPSPRGVEEGLLAGVGATAELTNKHHVAVELRAERSNGFSEAIGVSTSITRFFLLLNYDLSKPR